MSTFTKRRMLPMSLRLLAPCMALTIAGCSAGESATEPEQVMFANSGWTSRGNQLHTGVFYQLNDDRPTEVMMSCPYTDQWSKVPHLHVKKMFDAPLGV